MSDKNKETDLFRSVLPVGPARGLYGLLTDKQKQDIKRAGLGIT